MPPSSTVERIADPDRRIVDRTDGNRDQCAVAAVGMPSETV